MSILSSINSAGKICASRYFSVRHPIFLIFELTYRCNLSCIYCSRYNGSQKEEIGTQEICRIIKEAKGMGLLRAYFSGGEIFLREDFGQIIAYCRQLGLAVEVWSNGIIIPDKIEILKQIDSLTLSLDGPEMVHDNIRGKGSFAATIKAARLAKQNGAHVSFNFTLTRSNINNFPEFLDIALSFGGTIGFQPVSILADSVNDIKEHFPSREEFNQALGQVMALKRRYPLVIENSSGHLDYLRCWPATRRWSCLHGRAIFTVTPDGGLTVCTNSSRPAATLDLKNHSLKEAINLLQPFKCEGCACYGAYDASGAGSILPVRWEVFNFHVLNKWRR